MILQYFEYYIHIIVYSHYIMVISHCIMVRLHAKLYVHTLDSESRNQILITCVFTYMFKERAKEGGRGGLRAIFQREKISYQVL